MVPRKDDGIEIVRYKKNNDSITFPIAIVVVVIMTILSLLGYVWGNGVDKRFDSAAAEVVTLHAADKALQDNQTALLLKLTVIDERTSDMARDLIEIKEKLPRATPYELRKDAIKN